LNKFFGKGDNTYTKYMNEDKQINSKILNKKLESKYDFYKKGRKVKQQKGISKNWQMIYTSIGSRKLNIKKL